MCVRCDYTSTRLTYAKKTEHLQMQHPPRAFYIAVTQRPLNDRKQINIVLNAKVVTAGLVIGWVLIEMRALCLININIPILTIASARHVIFVAFGFAFFLYLYICTNERLVLICLLVRVFSVRGCSLLRWHGGWLRANLRASSTAALRTLTG